MVDRYTFQFIVRLKRKFFPFRFKRSNWLHSHVPRTHQTSNLFTLLFLQNLRFAWLTHPFHCCAFKFPQRHDPYRHAQRIKYLADLHKKCMNNKRSSDPKEKPVEYMKENSVSCVCVCFSLYPPFNQILNVFYQFYRICREMCKCKYKNKNKCLETYVLAVFVRA